MIDSPVPVSPPQGRSSAGTDADTVLTHVGRYVILRKLGEGAMGEVYVAYDENLDRRVAIKLVRTMGQRTDDVYNRMLREAHGLARLSHPNVVQVYEAGVFQGRVYLAMEYIEGESLREWSERSERSWREVLACAIEAGRGLAAAHQVGLVHRDFKPDNVIVGVDGRVRVLDFGLVRAESEGEEGDELLSVSGQSRVNPSVLSGASSLRSNLTQAHTLIGTPAYMSPEQHLRETADARSDVFAFSIVLYELLYGVRPFAGDDQAEIMSAVLKQSLSEPAEGRRAPAWVRRVLLRGLSVDPRARFPTMEEYLAALDNDPVRRRRRWWIAGGVVALLASVGALVVSAIQADAEACSGGAEGMRGVWDEARQEAVAAAFAATGVAYSGEVTARITQRLDDHRSAWIYSHREACLAHRRGERSSERLDLQMACLRAHRRELDAAIRTFIDADAAVVESAMATVSELTELDRLSACDDIEGLERGFLRKVDPEEAAKLEATRGALADAAALGRAGKQGAGLTSIAGLSETVEQLDDPALYVEVDLARGRLLLQDGAYEAAKKALMRSYYDARALGHDQIAAEATIDLLRIMIVMQAPPEAAEVWSRQAEAEVRLLGKELVQADFHSARASLHQALTILRRELDPHHYKVIEAQRRKGAALFKRGRNAEARTSLELALKSARVGLGAGHPQVANILTNLGLVAAREGRYEDGIRAAKEALEISEGARGREHPDNANILSNLGELEIQLGNYRAAVNYLERAVALGEAAYGDESPKAMLYIASLAVARYKLGDVDEAQVLMERAYLISESNLGPEHPTTGALRGNLGEVLNDRGRYAEARGHIEPALAAMRKAFGEERPELGSVQRELSRALLGIGEVDRAEVEARQALSLSLSGANIPGDELAKTRCVLARTMLAGDDADDDTRAEAELLVEAARRDAVGYEETNAAVVAEIQALERLIAERGPQRARPSK